MKTSRSVGKTTTKLVNKSLRINKDSSFLIEEPIKHKLIQK